MSPIELALTVHQNNHTDTGIDCKVVIQSLTDVYMICETPEELILGNGITYDSVKKIITDGKTLVSVKNHYEA